MDINWKELEKTLLSLTKNSIEWFGSEHEDEVFYGFAYDCNSQYGDAGICFNTEDSLRKLAKKMYPKMSAKKVNDELRWDPGDWEYRGVNYDSIYNVEASWEMEWEPFSSKLHKIIAAHRVDSIEAFKSVSRITDCFLTAVCRVLIELETSDVFNCVNKTDDFKVFAVDNDEDLAEGWHRLNKIRKVR